MAPDSCGDRVVVVSSPYKSHTLSLATIQLGQQHLEAIPCNPWPSGGVTEVGCGGQNSTPPPLSSFVLQPCFIRLTLHWMGNTISKNLNHPSIHAFCQIIRAPISGNPHAQTVEDLFPSSVVAAQTTTLGWNVPFDRQRYSPTRGDTGVAKRRRVRQRRINVRSAFRVFTTSSF